MEQEQVFEDVQAMKAQYDKCDHVSYPFDSHRRYLHASIMCLSPPLFTRLAQHHHQLMWEYLPTKDASLAAIPLLDKHITESATCIGQYPLQDVLGYGQYATVYASSAPAAAVTLAIKVIDKDKLTDLVALVRVNAEIASLRDPSIAGHPGVLAVTDVIHTSRFIYLVTERGGRDLFEHFGARSDGVDEPVVQALMFRVALAVQMLHRHNYCHRDLKPCVGCVVSAAAVGVVVLYLSRATSFYVAMCVYPVRTSCTTLVVHPRSSCSSLTLGCARKRRRRKTTCCATFAAAPASLRPRSCCTRATTVGKLTSGASAAYSSRSGCS